MTRTIALALVAALGTASVAAADSYFGIIDTQGGSAILDLGTVTSDAAGYVEIYRADTLLGSEPIHAGANLDVRVDVGTAPVSDVTAVLVSDGQILDQTRINVNN